VDFSTLYYIRIINFCQVGKKWFVSIIQAMKKKTIKRHKAKATTVKKPSISKKLVSLLPQVMPLGSRVLIRPFTKEELQKNNTAKNSFGIILPEAGSKDKSEQGIVLALGPGEYQDGKLIAPKVKVGDKVVFSKYGYEDVNINDEELFLIKEENILAILK